MKTTLVTTLTMLTLALSGCTESTELRQEGSSTVLPLAEVWAEAFGERTGVVVNIAGGGSGHGASGLCDGTLDFGDMSRAMKDSEKETCRANGIEPVEWRVAFDGLSVVVARENTFVQDLSVAQLEQIFRKSSPATRWTDVQPAIPGAPNAQIKICMPDNESGTYEYFHEVIMDGGEFRTDVQSSANDNVLVTCIGNDANAIGFFGFAYVKSNEDQIRPLRVDGVAPSLATIRDGTYEPLGRPLYVYSDAGLEGAARDYMHYILTDGQDLVEGVGYVPLSDEVQQAMLAQLGA